MDRDHEKVPYYNGEGLHDLQISDNRRAEVVIKPNDVTSTLAFPYFPYVDDKPE